MDESVLIMNGDDVTALLKEDGFKVVRNRVDGPNAGRTGNADMILDFLANKWTATASFRDLTDAEAARVFANTDGDAILIDYAVPGDTESRMVYCSSIPGILRRTIKGRRLWTGIEVQLVEI